MQGAGNDFVVLDETRGRLHLSEQQYRFLADRHFGVGADQILSVRPSPTPDADFEYVIHNADGGEVEQCGNGARCFVRYVKEKGLTGQSTVRVKVHGGIISLTEQADGRVTVDMGQPVFDLPLVPFDPAHAHAGVSPVNDFALWRLNLHGGEVAEAAVLSMGNPHAVVGSTQASCKLSTGASSICGSLSVVQVRPWPAAPGPVPPWLPASGWAGWINVWMCKPEAAA
jgi:diaminopimelate epimerase